MNGLFVKRISYLNVLLFALCYWRVEAQTYDTNNEVVQTFAGSGFIGSVDGVGVNTMFNNPKAIVADSHSNLFVWDKDSGSISVGGKIRKIVPDSTVTTTVRMGTFSGSFVLTIDRSDTIWGVDGFLTFYNGRSGLFGTPTIYKITGGTIVTTTNLFPLGIGNNINAFAGICADSLGNLYISDAITDVIYRYTTNGSLSVFAGSGNQGRIDGNGIFTSFNMPTVLACDQANNIYVWDSGNHLIRRIDQSQNVTTIAGKYQISSSADGVGTNAAFNSIYQMCVDSSGNVILACGTFIRQMDATTNVVTMAGSFTQSGYTNGAGNLARFNSASGVCIAGGMVFVADSSNYRIRQISLNPQSQVVGGANLGIGTFAGVTITGTVGRTYQVQSSPDTTNWTTRATLLLNSSPYLWIDQNPVSGNKFYRALLLP